MARLTKRLVPELFRLLYASRIPFYFCGSLPSVHPLLSMDF